MAEWVRIEMAVEYPLGSPESYGGETDPDKQVALEEEYLKDEGDYLFAVMSSDQTRVPVMTVWRVWRFADGSGPLT